MLISYDHSPHEAPPRIERGGNFPQHRGGSLCELGRNGLYTQYCRLKMSAAKNTTIKTVGSRIDFFFFLSFHLLRTQYANYIVCSSNMAEYAAKTNQSRFFAELRAPNDGNKKLEKKIGRK